MKRESLVKKIPWVGGSSISREQAPRGPAPLSFRDFFLAEPNFRREQSGHAVPANFKQGKALQYPTLRGW
jgi:hypothetical protein